MRVAQQQSRKPVKMKLIGQDGNAFALIGAFRRAALAAKWTPEQVKSVTDEMMSGDYNHLLAVLMENTTGH